METLTAFWFAVDLGYCFKCFKIRCQDL